jgi:hypothetical protein
MTSLTLTPLRFRLLIAMFVLIALLRGLSVVAHRPLLAFGNNYDQIRYTACLDLAPWRPGVDADRANPQAPLSRYAFQPLPKGTCVWTSDLLFTAPVAAAWRLSEALGGREIHSVRRLGELRLLAWLAVAAWATLALWRSGYRAAAVAHLGLFGLVGMDPANLLYLSTFYAEAAAAFGFYVCCAGAGVALLRPTRGTLCVAAFGAIVLATSKFQHLLLPLLLGAALLLAAGRDGRRAALAVLVGGLIGLGIQAADVLRDTPMARGVNTVNRANFVLSVLLPESSDRTHVAAALKLEEGCVGYAGKSVYAMPEPVERVCTQVNQWPRALPWWLLIADPPGLGRALMHVPALLLPWTPGLGVVEGGNFTPLPAYVPSLNGLFGDRHGVAAALLLLPWAMFVVLRLRRGTPGAARGFALMCAAGSSGVALVALFGDGDVEYAKHAHLAVNFALASLAIPAQAALQRFVEPTR